MEKSVFYTKEDELILNAIRVALISGKEVVVNNQYETVYGFGFDGWLRAGISDIACSIKVTKYNHFAGCGYPWTYVITPHKINFDAI